VKLVGSISRQTVSDRICGESRSGARSATTRWSSRSCQVLAEAGVS